MIVCGGIGWMSMTPMVFCAVMAVIAVMPWTPAAANALRSAWMPAPPPESEPAIERTRGVRSDTVRGSSPSVTRNFTRGTIGGNSYVACCSSAGRSRSRPLVGANSCAADESLGFEHPEGDADAARVAGNRGWIEAALDRVENAPFVVRKRRGIGSQRREPLGAADAEELVERIGSVADDRCTVAQEPVAAGGVGRGHASGDGGDDAAELGREAGGDERARGIGCLDDHRHRGDRGHDPVARGEGP